MTGCPAPAARSSIRTMNLREPHADAAWPDRTTRLFDDETGLLGAEAWDVVLAVESARCTRYGRTATVVIVEVASLDTLAEVWGADVGTIAAARVGSALRSRSRSSDYAARLGRGRFAVLLPETDEIAAVNFVERARTICDDVLRADESGARARFGWADATRDRSLIAAAATAVARLETHGGAEDGS